MRALYIVALVATALSTSAESASPVSISKMTTPGSSVLTRSFTADPHDNSIKRFLRTFKTVYDDDEDEDEDENEDGNSENIDESDDNIDESDDNDDDNDEERDFTGWGLLDDALKNTKLKVWQTQGKNADDAFNALKVDGGAGKFFESPQWNTWVRYVTMINKNDADETIVTKLMRQYGVDNLAKMLDTAKKNPNTKSMANTLEAAQLKFWLKDDYSNTPERIFTTLKLETATDDVFDSPQLATWVSYLNLYNEKHPNKRTTELEIFQNAYGEKELSKMLFSTKYAESAGAEKLTESMIQGWVEFAIPPSNLFKQLKLDKGGDKLLSSPKLVAWVKYMKIFNEKIPRKKTTIIEVFTKSYGEVGLAKMLEAAKSVSSTKKVATNLQDAQFGVWMVRGLSPDDVLTKVLKVDTKKLKTEPNAGIWRSYYRAYDEKNPGKLFSFKP